jgi:tRNA threonylcarbamoyladenosine biosynthesis protein TsaB
MMILALEFSSPRRSLALSWQEAGSGATKVLGTVSDLGDKSLRPIPLLQKLLAQTGTDRTEVKAIVVGLGPGSYTGIRSAIALAQGWQLALNVKTCGVSSVDALAVEAQQRGCFGRVSLVIDAQRQEFYLATYSITPAKRQLLEPLALVDAPTLSARAAQPDSILTGPEITKWIPNGRVLFPDAAALAPLADPRIQSLAGESLKPIYLREVTFVKSPQPRSLPAELSG